MNRGKGEDTKRRGEETREIKISKCKKAKRGEETRRGGGIRKGNKERKGKKRRKRRKNIYFDITAPVITICRLTETNTRVRFVQWFLFFNINIKSSLITSCVSLLLCKSDEKVN